MAEGRKERPWQRPGWGPSGLAGRGGGSALEGLCMGLVCWTRQAQLTGWVWPDFNRRRGPSVQYPPGRDG